MMKRKLYLFLFFFVFSFVSLMYSFEFYKFFQNYDFIKHEKLEKNELSSRVIIIASPNQLTIDFFKFIFDKNMNFFDMSNLVKRYNDYFGVFMGLNNNFFMIFSGIEINSDGYILSTSMIPDGAFIYVLLENEILPYNKVYGNRTLGISLMEPLFERKIKNYVDIFSNENNLSSDDNKNYFFILDNELFYNIKRKIHVENKNETLLLNNIPLRFFRIYAPSDTFVLIGSPVYDNRNLFYGIIYAVLPDNNILVMEKKYLRNSLNLLSGELENLYEEILNMNKVNMLNNLKQNIISTKNIMFTFDGLVVLNDFWLLLFNGGMEFKKNDIIRSLNGKTIKTIDDLEKYIIDDFFEKNIKVNVLRDGISQDITLKKL